MSSFKELQLTAKNFEVKLGKEDFLQKHAKKTFNTCLASIGSIASANIYIIGSIVNNAICDENFKLFVCLKSLKQYAIIIVSLILLAAIAVLMQYIKRHDVINTLSEACELKKNDIEVALVDSDFHNEIIKLIDALSDKEIIFENKEGDNVREELQNKVRTILNNSKNENDEIKIDRKSLEKLLKVFIKYKDCAIVSNKNKDAKYPEDIKYCLKKSFDLIIKQKEEGQDHSRHKRLKGKSMDSHTIIKSR